LKYPWPAVGVGLHLTVPSVRRDGRKSKFSSHEPKSGIADSHASPDMDDRSGDITN
jgi:hypothetical protein